MLTTGSLKAALESGTGGVITLYSGTEPATADDDVTGATAIVTFTVGGDGSTPLTFETPAANGSLVKATAETWQGTVASTGTANFYRHYIQSDTGALSTTALRVQGTVGIGGSDLNMTDNSLTATDVETVDYYSINLPEV